MWTEKEIAEAVLWISLILLTPAVFSFFKSLTRYLLNKYVYSRKIIVTHKRNGIPYKIERYAVLEDGSVDKSVELLGSTSSE